MLIKLLKNEMVICVVLIALTLIAYLIKFMLNSFLAQHMRPDLFGDYSLAVRFMMLSAMIVLLGTGGSAKSFFYPYFLEKHSSSLFRYIAWNFHLIKNSILVCIVVSVSAVVIIYGLHYFQIRHWTGYHLVIYALLTTPICALSLLLISYIASTNSPLLANFLNNTIMSLLFFLFFFASIEMLDVSIAKNHIVLVWLLSFFVLTFVSTVFLSFKIPYFVRNTLSNFWYYRPTSNRKVWFQKSIYMLGINVILVLTNVADLTIVEIIHPQESSVALYVASMVIAGFIFLIPDSIYNFVKPRIAPLLDRPDRCIQIQKILNKAAGVTVPFVVMATLVIIILSKPLLLQFGSIYPAAYKTLIILSIGACFSLLTAVGTVLLTYHNHEKIVIRLAIYELIAIIIGAALLTYFYGIIGAAITIMFVRTIKAMLILVLIRKKLNLKPIGFV